MRELGRKILRGREFQTKQKANVTIEFCLLYPKSSFYIKSSREMGSVAHGEVGVKKSLWGMNQGRRKNTAEREGRDVYWGQRDRSHYQEGPRVDRR